MILTHRVLVYKKVKYERSDDKRYDVEEEDRLRVVKNRDWGLGFKKAKINRDWVQKPHFNDRITQTIISCPLWRLVTREKHSRS